MTRETYVWHDGRLIPAALFYAQKHEKHSKRAPFSTPGIAGDYETYDCPITGQPIEGRAAHRENLKKHGCRLLEPGETREASRKRQESFDAEMAKILKE
ncbi:MAG: hypothetical protein VX464_11715 [Pseudomonadota bacterium]|nr:hypothetical protein [Pseudomonadota bacterium]